MSTSVTALPPCSLDAIHTKLSGVFQDRPDDLIEQVRRGVDAEPKYVVEVEAFVGRVRGHAQGRPGNSVLKRHLGDGRGLHVETRSLRKVSQQAVPDLARGDDLVPGEDHAGADDLSSLDHG